MRAENDLLIIGAGPSGLALSYLLPGRARILEQSSEVGGLCRSIELSGAVFDIGGHSFHSPHPEVSRLVESLMQGNWCSQRRDARVLFRGELIDYPFQQHLEQISDKQVAAECARFLPRGGAVEAQNFEDWILKRFGEGVARHFMLPYNRKLWARDLKRMSCEWVGERVAPSDPNKAHDGPGRAPLRRDNEVAYPAQGGFGEIYRAMAQRCGPIEFDEAVVRVDPKERIVETANGAVWSWRRLVSTMPLPALLRAIDDCPRELIADADKLEFVSLRVLMLVIGETLKDQPQRIYVPDAHVPPHKIAFNHTSSPSLRARPRHGIICEVAYSNDKPPPDDDALVNRTLDALVAHKLVGQAKDLVEARVLDVVHGYPVYTPERPAILGRIETFLSGLGIRSIGRFGHWDYVNSDGCIFQAHTLAKSMLAEA